VRTQGKASSPRFRVLFFFTRNHFSPPEQGWVFADFWRSREDAYRFHEILDYLFDAEDAKKSFVGSEDGKKNSGAVIRRFQSGPALLERSIARGGAFKTFKQGTPPLLQLLPARMLRGASSDENAFDTSQIET